MRQGQLANVLRSVPPKLIHINTYTGDCPHLWRENSEGRREGCLKASITKREAWGSLGNRSLWNSHSAWGIFVLYLC